MWLPGQRDRERVSLSRRKIDNWNVLNCSIGFSLSHSKTFVIIMLKHKQEGYVMGIMHLM